MQVPVYERQARQEGIPNVQQNIRVDASNFLGGTEAAALKFGEQATSDINRATHHHYTEQLKEARQTRILDAATQMQAHVQDVMYGQNGALTKTGADAFLGSNGKTVSDLTFDDALKKQNEIADTLSDEEQKSAFKQHTSSMLMSMRGQLMGHEAQQHRVYTQSTLESSNAVQSRNIEFNYNDHEGMQASRAQMEANNAQLAKLHGYDEQWAQETTRNVFSSALKAANAAAIQKNDMPAVMANIERWSKDLDPATVTALQHEAVSGYGANELQTNPQGLADLTKPNDTVLPKLSLEQIKQLRDKLESHGKDYNADGSAIMHVDKDGIASKYKNQVRTDVAFNPGYGVRPAANDSPEEFNRVGDDLLKAHHDHYQGDTEKTLAAYNGGRGGVDSAIKAGGDWQGKAGVKNYIEKARNELAKTGTPIDYASPEQKLQLNRSAESMLERSRSVERSNLSNLASNQYAQTYNTGKPGDMIPKESFLSAYGDKGEAEYQSYQDSQAHAATAFSLKDMPTAKLNETVAAAMPKDDTDATREWKQYDELVSIADHVQNERMKDPVVAAAQLGFSVKPVNWSNPTQAAQEIAGRITVSDQMSEKYGTPPTILSKEEAKGLDDTFGSMPVKDQLSFMNTLKKHAEPLAYNMTMQQLRKDSPVTALAGALYGIEDNFKVPHWYGDNDTHVNGQKAAETILKGERMLNPTKDDKSQDGQNKNLYMPEDKELQSVFDTATNGAFAGKEQTAKNTFAAFRAAYAGLSIGLDDRGKLLNENRSKEALRMVTGTKGGAIDAYNNKIIPPYGMPETIFKDKVEAQFNDQVKDGLPHDIDHYKIIPLDEGVYGFTDGNDMKPIVINLNKAH